MTVRELIEELRKHDNPDLDVIVVWNGYQRNIIAVEQVSDELVRLIDKPRTAS